MRVCLFSQSLFALSLDDAIRAVADAGYAAIELACWGPHLTLELAQRDGARVAAAVREARLDVAALSLSNIFTSRNTLDNEIADAAAFLCLAGLFGAETIKLTPGPPASAEATGEHWRCLGDAVRRLAPAAEDAGVRLAFETHMRQLTDTIDSALRFLDLADSVCVGLTVDFCNLAFAGDDVTDAVRRLGPRLYHAHVKNGYLGPGGEWNFTALDSGLVDYAAPLRALAESGYAGYLSVECLGADAQTAPVATARRDLGVLRGFLREQVSVDPGVDGAVG